jgi:hypothetical protein
MAVSGDRGAALVVTLLAMTLVTALGIGIMILADTERLVAANFERSVETLYAADAMAGRTIGDLRGAADWNVILAGGVHSAFSEATRSPRLPSGVTLNLDAITAEVQSQSDALGPAGPNRPVWRLFAWGPLAQLPAASSDQYGAAWVADDRFENDGNAAVDGNDVIAIHAEAYGWSGARRVVEVIVSRRPAACEPAGDYWVASATPISTLTALRSRIPDLSDLQNCNHSGPPEAPRLLSWREVR